MLRAGSTLLLLVTVIRAQTPPIPAARSAEVYSVYSFVVQNPKLSHQGSHKKFLIQDTTGFKGESPGTCVTPPPEYRSAFAEVMADFSHHRDEAFHLDRKFTLSLPYELLDARDSKQFQDLSSRDDVDKFRGATDLVELGPVYFNLSRNLAVVKVGAWCGNLCGLWTTRVLEKKEDGPWQELKWTSCVTVATGPSNVMGALSRE